MSPVARARWATLVLLAITGCATGGPRSDPPPALGSAMRGGVPSAGTTFAGSQQVLTRASGGLYLAYTKAVDGVNQLYIALSTDGGQTWADYPQISAGPTRSSNPHLLTMPDRRGLVVFWTKQIDVDAEEAEDLEYKPTGIVGVGDILPAADQTLEAVGSKEEGEEEEEGPPRIRQIFFSRFDGTRWSPQTQLTEGGYNGFPTAVYDSRGVLHLVWYGADGTYYQIVYTRLENGSWRRPELVSLGYPDSIIPAIAVDARDDLHVAWYKYTATTRSYQVYYRRHAVDGDRWTEQIQLSVGLKVAMNAAVVVAPDQTVYVVYDGDTDAQSGTSIYVRTLRGGVWSGQTRVGRGDLDAERPSMTLDGHDRPVVLYHSLVDDQIHATRSTDWSAEVPLTTAGKNRSPNVSWRGARGGAGVEYVWTVVDADPANPAGGNLIRYALLGD